MRYVGRVALIAAIAVLAMPAPVSAAPLVSVKEAPALVMPVAPAVDSVVADSIAVAPLSFINIDSIAGIQLTALSEDVPAAGDSITRSVLDTFASSLNPVSRVDLSRQRWCTRSTRPLNEATAVRLRSPTAKRIASS